MKKNCDKRNALVGFYILAKTLSDCLNFYVLDGENGDPWLPAKGTDSHGKFGLSIKDFFQQQTKPLVLERMLMVK